eukprot:TRINITY_DN27062_c0_g1_i3.p1 TRINITY_DN27062_c0_g1~~TRINITY_DN27062_c0_g1_i3.p1  ORF type:complete len:823 (+),score=201.51 TRINITY_DN27062_c0_g1_i3:74-2542(+)
MSHSLYDDCETLPAYVKSDTPPAPTTHEAEPCETPQPNASTPPPPSGAWGFSQSPPSVWASTVSLRGKVIDGYMDSSEGDEAGPAAAPTLLPGGEEASPGSAASTGSSSSRLTRQLSDDTVATATTIVAETTGSSPSPPESPAQQDVPAANTTSTIVCSSSASVSSLPILTASFFRGGAGGTGGTTALPPLETLETLTEEVWENQRWLPATGWRPASSSLDRTPFSDKTGSNVRIKEGMQLPYLWVWVGDWQVDVSGHPTAGDGGAEKSAKGGWYYAGYFTTSISQCKIKPGKMDVVRRRRWLRVRTRVSEQDLLRIVKQGNTGASFWCDCERYGFPPPPRDTAPPPSHSWTSFQKHHNALHIWQAHLGLVNVRHVFTEQIKIEGKPGDVKGKIRDLIRKHGVPPSLRGSIWALCSGAARKKTENDGYYRCVIEKNMEEFGWRIEDGGVLMYVSETLQGGATSPSAASGSGVDSPNRLSPGSSPTSTKSKHNAWCTELEKDLARTFVDHPYFSTGECPGRQKLRRVLSALSYRNPLVNYCQAFNYVCGYLLLNTGEEDAFWLMVALLEDVLPNDYYNTHLVGITVDLRVLEDLIADLCPTLSSHFDEFNIDVAPFAAGWIMNLYVNVFPIEVTMRIWDVLFAQGPKIIFRVVVGVLRLFEQELLRMQSVGEVLEFLTTECKRLHDPTELFKAGLTLNLGKTKLTRLREKHRKDVMKEVDMRRHVSELEKREQEVRHRQRMLLAGSSSNSTSPRAAPPARSSVPAACEPSSTPHKGGDLISPEGCVAAEAAAADLPQQGWSVGEPPAACPQDPTTPRLAVGVA